MLFNYLKTAIRSLYRNKLYSFINIFGLCIGLVSTILLALYVQFELSYDKHFPNSERISRIVVDLEANDWAISAFPIGGILHERFPQIESYTRIKPQNDLIRSENSDEYILERIFYSDSTVFSFFNLKLLRGNPKSVFSDDNSVVVTQQIADKYYPNQDAIGKALHFNNRESPVIITGIVEEPKVNSHFHAHIIANSMLFPPMRPDYERPWSYLTSHYTYFLMANGTDTEALEFEINDYMGEYHDVPLEERGQELQLQALESIHLNSDRGLEIEANGSEEDVYIFSTIALFILLIASINFTNLSTAQSLKRAKEVGIRKTIGGNKAQLVFQFLGESFIITFIAMLIGVLLLTLLVPEFNEITAKELSLNPIDNQLVLPLFLGLTLIVGLLSGIYPAFVLSAFSPIKVLKGSFTSNISGQNIRRALVVLQFGIAFVIMVGTYVIRDQLSFMLDKDLGFDKDNLMVFAMPNDSIGDAQLKTELLRIPEVQNVTRFLEKPGYMVRTTTFWHEGSPGTDGTNTYTFSGDSDFDETFGLEVLRGEYFSDDNTDGVQEFVVNEAAAQAYGWHIDSVVGKQMEFGSKTDSSGRVIGLVSNFHFKHLQEEIEPLVFYSAGSYEGRFMGIKLQTTNLRESIDKIEAIWSDFVPSRPFNYEFMDEEFNRLFEKEKTLMELFALFSGLAVFVSCLGLFGLASFSIEQRRKSLAIRKVLGADIINLVRVFSKEFMILVGLGVILGIPISWYLMKEWLSNFAYRIELGPGVYIIAFMTAAFIAIVTISYHATKAATENPLYSLKDE